MPKRVQFTSRIGSLFENLYHSKKDNKISILMMNIYQISNIHHIAHLGFDTLVMMNELSTIGIELASVLVLSRWVIIYYYLIIARFT